MALLGDKGGSSSPARKLLILSGVGALAMFFFDPDRGGSRRAQARDRAAAVFRRGYRKAERAGRYAASEAYGVTQKAAHLGDQEEPPPNDQALVAKVESEVLRRAEYPKGSISINAEDGVVVLRGQVDSQKLISELEQDVRKVTGVRDVANLLHLPGEPAPNKEAAIDAGKGATRQPVSRGAR